MTVHALGGCFTIVSISASTSHAYSAVTDVQLVFVPHYLAVAVALVGFGMAVVAVVVPVPLMVLMVLPGSTPSSSKYCLSVVLVPVLVVGVGTTVPHYAAISTPCHQHYYHSSSSSTVSATTTTSAPAPKTAASPTGRRRRRRRHHSSSSSSTTFPPTPHPTSHVQQLGQFCNGDPLAAEIS